MVAAGDRVGSMRFLASKQSRGAIGAAGRTRCRWRRQAGVAPKNWAAGGSPANPQDTAGCPGYLHDCQPARRHRLAARRSRFKCVRLPPLPPARSGRPAPRKEHPALRHCALLHELLPPDGRRSRRCAPPPRAEVWPTDPPPAPTSPLHFSAGMAPPILTYEDLLAALRPEAAPEGGVVAYAGGRLTPKQLEGLVELLQVGARCCGPAGARGAAQLRVQHLLASSGMAGSAGRRCGCMLAKPAGPAAPGPAPCTHAAIQDAGPGLRVLKLKGAGVDDDGAEQLSRALAFNEGLEVRRWRGGTGRLCATCLCVSRSRRASSGASFQARAPHAPPLALPCHNPTEQVLDLRQNAIGRRGADCLANALRSFNRSLLALDLSGGWVEGGLVGARRRWRAVAGRCRRSSGERRSARGRLRVTRVAIGTAPLAADACPALLARACRQPGPGGVARGHPRAGAVPAPQQERARRVHAARHLARQGAGALAGGGRAGRPWLCAALVRPRRSTPHPSPPTSHLRHSAVLHNASPPTPQIRIQEVASDTPAGRTRLTLQDAELERRWAGATGGSLGTPVVGAGRS